MILFYSMVDEEKDKEKDEEGERDEEKKEGGLEKFFRFVDRNEFSPLTLSYEPASNAKNNIFYYPTVITKGGEKVIGYKALNLENLKIELFRLQRVLIRKEYDIINLKLPI